MEIFGLDLKEIATPHGIITILCIIVGMLIYLGFNYLIKQSELAHINKEQQEQILKLSNDLGRIRGAYEHVVNSLDISQQQVIFLKELLNSENFSNSHRKQQK